MAIKFNYTVFVGVRKYTFDNYADFKRYCDIRGIAIS